MAVLDLRNRTIYDHYVYSNNPESFEGRGFEIEDDEKTVADVFAGCVKYEVDQIVDDDYCDDYSTSATGIDFVKYARNLDEEFNEVIDYDDIEYAWTIDITLFTTDDGGVRVEIPYSGDPIEAATVEYC